MTVYTTILMDPPWNERGGGVDILNRELLRSLLRNQPVAVLSL